MYSLKTRHCITYPPFFLHNCSARSVEQKGGGHGFSPPWPSHKHRQLALPPPCLSGSVHSPVKQSSLACPTPEPPGTQCWGCSKLLSSCGGKHQSMSIPTAGRAQPMFPGVLSTSGCACLLFYCSYSCNYCPYHTPSALPCLSLDTGLTSVSICSGCRSPQPRCRHSGREHSTQQPLRTALPGPGGKGGKRVLYAASWNSSVGISSSYPTW